MERGNSRNINVQAGNDEDEKNACEKFHIVWTQNNTLSSNFGKCEAMEE